jgi:hypothetical protein
MLISGFCVYLALFKYAFYQLPKYVASNGKLSLNEVSVIYSRVSFYEGVMFWYNWL